jgi:phenylacetate-CoA ligase
MPMNAVQDAIYKHLPAALQSAVISWHGARILRERFTGEFDRWMEFLEESQWYSAEEMTAWQDERLRKLIVHAYETVPLYREVMDREKLRPEDIRGRADLWKMPVLERETVRARPRDLLSTAVPERDRRTTTTSGTTGTPLELVWDWNVCMATHACSFRIRKWADFPFGRPYATSLGRPVVPVGRSRPPFWRYNRPWNQLFLSPLHVSAENLPIYIRELRRRGIEALEAYPSTAYFLACSLKASGETLPLHCVFTSGEPLMEAERELIEERFEAQVFDGYSQSERVAFTGECERHEGHHIFGEYGIVEVLDQSREPDGPGAMGELVATSLHNFAMPFIRYAFNDTVMTTDRMCSCGRGLPMLDGITTREEDILVTADGRVMPPISLAYWTFIVPGIERAQLIQHEPGEIRARAVRKQPFTETEREDLVKYFQTKFGPDIRVVLETVDEIPLSPRGKFRRVISTVPLPDVFAGPQRSEREGWDEA